MKLPLEYQAIPEYFDAWNNGEDTEVKNDFLEEILKKNGVKTVLDMTCGTGSQVFYLAERGYDVTGSDFSPALLDQARKKALDKNLNLQFIDGDVRSLRVGQFDAVITMFNAVGHLTKFGFEQAMRNVFENLKDGGLYVFDLFDLEATTPNVMADFACCMKANVDGITVLKSQCSVLNEKRGRLTSYDVYTFQKNGQKPRTKDHAFSLQLYRAQELSALLLRTGFHDVSHHAWPAQHSLLTVAQKC